MKILPFKNDDCFDRGVLFHSLCEVVRGASRNTHKLEGDQVHAAAEMLSSDHAGLTKRETYMRLNLATAHLLSDQEDKETIKDEILARFKRAGKKAGQSQAVKQTQGEIDEAGFLVHVRRIGALLARFSMTLERFLY